MRRRTFAVLALLAILTSGFVAATATRLAPPALPLLPDDSDEAPSAADSVTLYQNGLGFVALNRTLISEGGEARLVIRVPTSALLDSLRVEGEGVVTREVRSTLAPAGAIRIGDALVVHVADGRFEGTLSDMEGSRLVLRSASGSVVVDAGRASAIEVIGRAAPAGGMAAADVTLVLSAPEGTHDVRISYLYHGSGWTPSYHLDATTGHLVMFGTLTAPDAWRGVRLSLVTGTPNVVYAPHAGHYALRAMSYDSTLAMSGEASYSPSFAASAPMGDLYVYAYDEPVDADLGETLRLPLLQGTFNVLRRYHEVDTWAQDGTLSVRDRMHVRSTLADPLPSGVVRIFRDGAWLADDRLPRLAVGEQANLTLAIAMDVKATSRLVRHVAGTTVDSWEYELRVENLKNGAAARDVDLRAVLRIPTHETTRTAAVPTPAEEGPGHVTWNERLQPGEGATFRVAYDQRHPPR